MTMAATGVFEGTDDLTLKGGLLIYGDSNKSRLVTAHAPIPPEAPGMAPRLGPAVLINREAILDLFKGLDSAPQERFLLPENCLCWEAGLLCWWRPAARRRIFFKAQNDALNQLSGSEVMHPPLLFRVWPGAISVWALKQDKRPTEDTVLCRAPYFNVYENGLMCNGSVILPDYPQPNNIPLWEECFFGSNFAHGNAQELTTHPKGHTGYWVGLSKPNATKAMATKYLRETKLTVDMVLRGKD
jgi:PRTRC genetic system protein B